MSVKVEVLGGGGGGIDLSVHKLVGRWMWVYLCINICICLHPQIHTCVCRVCVCKMFEIRGLGGGVPLLICVRIAF